MSDSTIPELDDYFRNLYFPNRMLAPFHTFVLDRTFLHQFPSDKVLPYLDAILRTNEDGKVVESVVYEISRLPNIDSIGFIIERFIQPLTDNKDYPRFGQIRYTSFTAIYPLYPHQDPRAEKVIFDGMARKGLNGTEEQKDEFQGQCFSTFIYSSDDVPTNELAAALPILKAFLTDPDGLRILGVMDESGIEVEMTGHEAATEAIKMIERRMGQQNS